MHFTIIFKWPWGCTEERCSLTVLATVISRPNKEMLIIDAGSKCFGLDKGAHGIALIKGFGYVKAIRS